MSSSLWLLGELRFPRDYAERLRAWRSLSLDYPALSGWPTEGFFSVQGEPGSATVGEALDRLATITPPAVPGAKPFRLRIEGGAVRLRGYLGRQEFEELHRDLGALVRRGADVGATGSLVIVEERGDFAYRLLVANNRNSWEEVAEGEISEWLSAGVVPGVTEGAALPVVSAAGGRPLLEIAPADADIHRRICSALDGFDSATIADAARRRRATLSLQLRGQGRGERPIDEIFPDGDSIREALRHGSELLELGHGIWTDLLLRRGFDLLAELDFAVAEAIALDAVEPNGAYGALRSAATGILSAGTGERALDALLVAVNDPYIGDDTAVALGRIASPAAGERLLVALAEFPESSMDHPEVRNIVGRIVRALGWRRERTAVRPLLALWNGLSVGGLRAEIGEALCAIGTPEALEPLAGHWESEHTGELLTAARATLLLDAARAYDRLAHFFESPELATRTGRSAAIAIIDVLTCDAHPDRYENSVGFLDADPRWIDLALRLLPGEELGWNAMQLLPFVEDPRVLPALLSRLGEDDLEDVCEALQKLGDPAAIAPIEGRLAATKEKGEAVKLKKLLLALRKQEPHRRRSD